MAQEHVIRLIDDLDGGVATQTIVFGYQGRSYEIDLNDDNAKSLDDFLKPYVGSGRLLNARPGRPAAGSGARRSSTRSDNTPIRDWARANGFTVADGGRLPQQVRDSYFAAHPGEVDPLDGGADDELEVDAETDEAPAAAAEPDFSERAEQDAGEMVSA